jgi:hypothetical protein
VVDLSSSSNEEGLIPDTSRDAKFARQLFSNLNRDILGPLGDSDEEEVMHEETATDATPFVAEKPPAPPTSATDVDEDPWKMQDGNSDGLAPNQDIGNSSSDGDEASLP